LLPALVVVLLAACGGSSHPAAVSVAATTVAAATTTTTVAPVDYKQQYLAIVTPANNVDAAFASEAKALPSSATGPEVAKLAAPVIAADEAAIQKLLRVPWPANVLNDMKAFTVAVSTLDADLANVATQNALTISSWGNQFTTDEGKLVGQKNIVRADLGLPPS